MNIKTIYLALLVLLLKQGLSISFGSDRLSTKESGILHVRGSVKYVLFHGDVPDTRLERSFELWVNGCESYARLNSGVGSDAGPFVGFEAYCHADSVDLANILDPSHFTTQAKSTKPVEIITNQVLVFNGPVPFGGLSHFTPVWFAYASDFVRRNHLVSIKSTDD